MPIPDVSDAQTRRTVAVLLAGQVAVAVLLETFRSTPPTYALVWYGFLLGVPAALAGFVLAGHRWALFVTAMYGTVELALDLATVLQELTRASGDPLILSACAASSVMTAAVIVIAGRGFLAAMLGGKPRVSPPPNRPSQPSM
jgi:hypothetical protein